MLITIFDNCACGLPFRKDTLPEIYNFTLRAFARFYFRYKEQNKSDNHVAARYNALTGCNHNPVCVNIDIIGAYAPVVDRFNTLITCKQGHVKAGNTFILSNGHIARSAMPSAEPFTPLKRFATGKILPSTLLLRSTKAINCKIISITQNSILYGKN